MGESVEPICEELNSDLARGEVHNNVFDNNMEHLKELVMTNACDKGVPLHE